MPFQANIFLWPKWPAVLQCLCLFFWNVDVKRTALNSKFDVAIKVLKLSNLSPASNPGFLLRPDLLCHLCLLAVRPSIYPYARGLVHEPAPVHLFLQESSPYLLSPHLTPTLTLYTCPPHASLSDKINQRVLCLFVCLFFCCRLNLRPWACQEATCFQKPFTDALLFGHTYSARSGKGRQGIKTHSEFLKRDIYEDLAIKLLFQSSLSNLHTFHPV